MGIKLRNKTLSFIKKYPLSIFSGIIVINLITISGYLRFNAKLAHYKEACSRYIAFYSYETDQQAEKNELKTAKTFKVSVELVDAYCQRIVIA